MKPKAGVYKITCTTTGKVYVGSAANFRTRWSNHRWHLRRKTHHSPHLQNAWNKYGESAFVFEIIEGCEPTKEALLSRETFWIADLQATNPEHGYNTISAAGSHMGLKRSPETIEKLRLVNKGRVRTAEEKMKVSLANRGSVVSPERRKHMSEVMSTKKYSPSLKSEVIESIQSNGVMETHRKTGIPSRTLYTWKQLMDGGSENGDSK